MLLHLVKQKIIISPGPSLSLLRDGNGCFFRRLSITYYCPSQWDVLYVCVGASTVQAIMTQGLYRTHPRINWSLHLASKGEPIKWIQFTILITSNAVLGGGFNPRFCCCSYRWHPYQPPIRLLEPWRLLFCITCIGVSQVEPHSTDVKEVLSLAITNLRMSDRLCAHCDAL